MSIKYSNKGEISALRVSQEEKYLLSGLGKAYEK